MIEPKPAPLEAAQRLCGRSAKEVYRFLFDHSSMDKCRRTYNTSNWSVKGISSEVGMKRDTVARAIDKLLDNGFIGIAGHHASPNGSHVIVWSVYAPDWIPNVRHSLEIMTPPSERLKKIRAKAKKVQLSESLLSWEL